VAERDGALPTEHARPPSERGEDGSPCLGQIDSFDDHDRVESRRTRLVAASHLASCRPPETPSVNQAATFALVTAPLPACCCCLPVLCAHPLPGAALSRSIRTA
jgi:hypothetical protein